MTVYYLHWLRMKYWYAIKTLWQLFLGPELDLQFYVIMHKFPYVRRKSVINKRATPFLIKHVCVMWTDVAIQLLYVSVIPWMLMDCWHINVKLQSIIMLSSASTIVSDLGQSLPLVLWCCWLGGRKGIRSVKNWVMGCWHVYVFGSRCRFAYGPADAGSPLLW